MNFTFKSGTDSDRQAHEVWSLADGKRDHPGRWSKAVSEKGLTEIFSSLTDVIEKFFRKSIVKQMYKKVIWVPGEENPILIEQWVKASVAGTR